MFQKIKNNTKGFTLIEVMVVIIMVGILASIAFPMYLTHAKKAKMTDAIMNVKTLASYIMEKKMAGKAWNDNPTTTTPNDTLPLSTILTNIGIRERYFTLSVSSVTTDNFTITSTPISNSKDFTQSFKFTYKDGFDKDSSLLQEYADYVLP